MSFSYDRYDRQQLRSRTGPSQRTALGYWIPLGLTIATATIGFATWIWNERNSNDHDDDDGAYQDRSDTYRNLKDSDQFDQSTTAGLAESQDEYTGNVEAGSQGQQGSIVTRMSGAIRRTPSPQQFFDGASRRVAAGVVAAGALVGRGLTAIRETDDDFQDHERWSTEAEMRNQAGVASSTNLGRGLPTEPKKSVQLGGKKRMIAVVVSGIEEPSVWEGATQAYEIEHPSILSHLPQDINHDSVDLVVLIYAPNLHRYSLQTPVSPRSKPRPGSSTASSYSNISTPAADEDGLLDLNPEESNENKTIYESLRASALNLVSHPTHVLPFTTRTGHIHLLRHLCPSLVYLDESLSGLDGDNVREIENWVGQIVIVIGGDGLADTETEDEGGNDAADKGWWKDSTRVGLGKAEIVDSSRVAEDWAKRTG